MMQTKPKLFFTFLTILFLGGLFSISYYALTQRQEVRQKAATPEGSAALILTPSAQEFSVGKTESIKVTASVADSSINGYQVVAKISGTIPPDLTFVPADTPDVEIVKSELTDQDGGTKLFTFVANAKNKERPLPSHGSFLSIGEFRFTPQSTGTLSVSFDQTRSKVTRNKSKGENTLNLPTNTTFTVVEPSETGTSALTPGATPGATCGNNVCEELEYVPCPKGANCIWAGSCPSDCVAGNKCLNGATCNSGATCPAVCTMSFPPQCQAGICPGPSSSPTPTPTCIPLPKCSYEGEIGPNGQKIYCSIPEPASGRYCPRPSPTPTPSPATNQCANQPDGSNCSLNNCPTCLPGQPCPLFYCQPQKGICRGGHCVPTLTPTPTPTNDCAGRQDGTSCVLGTVCPVCPPGSTTCPKFPCYQQSGVCRNQNCGPLVSPTPTPSPKPTCQPRPICLDTPESRCYPQEPPGGWCPPTPTPTPMPVNSAPQIRNRSLPEGRVRTQYSAEVIATDPDPGDIVTITASGLPDRLRLTCNAGRRSILPNTQTMCRIEGEPTKRGTFDVRILARDSRGASTRRTFSLTIVRRRAPLPILQPLFDRLPF